MVDPSTAFFKEFRDRRIGVCRLEQLDPALAQREHCHSYLLVFDDLGVRNLEPECVRPKLQCLRNIFRRYAEMVDVLRAGTSRRQCNGRFYKLFNGGVKISVLRRHPNGQIVKLRFGSVPAKNTRQEFFTEQLNKTPPGDRLLSYQTH